MIFPQYNYKDYNNSNKSEWPTTNWNKMVNDSYKYCENIENPYEFEGICEDILLPSYHPYWKIATLIKLIQDTTRIKNKLAFCIEFPDKFKTEFSNLVSPQDIAKLIQEAELKINNHKYLKYATKRLL
jgi:hypothetical protein